MKNPTSPLIAIVGMTGSGKSEASEYFKQKGYITLRFGSVVDDEITKAGHTWSPEWTAHFRKKIREEHGELGVAKLMLPKIETALLKTDKVLIDGLYSWKEYLFLKEIFPQLTTLALYVRRDLRYKRLQERQERPFTHQESFERDTNEIELLNKGGPIAFADYLIKNEAKLSDLHNALDEYLLWIQTE